MGTLRLAPRSAPDRPPAAVATPPPVTAAPVSRIDRRVVDLALCRERFPVVFDVARPLPLAIGVDKPLGAILGAKRARFLLAWWCGHPDYVAAVARGGARYSLDGTEDGQVSERQRAVASLSRAGRVVREPGEPLPGDFDRPSISEPLAASPSAGLGHVP